MFLFFLSIEVILFVLISLVLIFILLILSNIFAPKQPHVEKSSSYECGFEPFSDSRNTFEIHFYIIGILFIIFDVEISFLVPWVLTLNGLNLFAWWAMWYFLYFFLVGFIYEIKAGLLTWTDQDQE